VTGSPPVDPKVRRITIANIVINLFILHLSDKSLPGGRGDTIALG
jgi:hypothetical protein